MEILNDNSLEELGFIKEIDTLKIIEESNHIKNKKKNKLLVLFFTLMVITAFIGQILFIQIFDRINFIRVGISTYAFISIALALVLIDKGEQNLC